MAVLATCASAQFQFGTGMPANIGFVDISTTGGTALMSDDDATIPITTTIGNFAFPAGPVLISNNGMAIAGVSGGDVSFINSSMMDFPASAGVPQSGTAYLLPFWDDLQPISGAENTTVYWQELAGVLYIMWKNEGHFGAVSGQTVTFEIQVFSDPSSCGACIQYLYPDSVFGGSQSSADNGHSATVGYAGTGTFNSVVFQLGFNAASVPTNTVFSVVGPAKSLTISSPAGPGSLLLQYGNSSCFGGGNSWVLAATLNAGTWPSGWLFGVDIPLPEFFSELSSGAPFTGPGGAFSFGTVTGLPPVTFYAVVISFNGGLFDGHSNAVKYTIP